MLPWGRLLVAWHLVHSAGDPRGLGAAAAAAAAAAAGGGQQQDVLAVLSALPAPAAVRWLQGGRGDKRDGQLVGTAPAGSVERPALYSVNTFSGHAFRAIAGGARSEAFAHEGGGLNVAALRLAPAPAAPAPAEGGRGGGAAVEVELLGPGDLGRLSRRLQKACGLDLECAALEARTPRLGLSLEPVLPQLLRSGGPGDRREAQPALRPLASRGGRISLGDMLLVVNGLRSPLKVFWVDDPTWDAEGELLGVVDSADTASGGCADDDGAAAVCSAHGDGGGRVVGHCMQVRSTPGHSFYVATHAGTGSVRRSGPIKYPGEVALLGVAEGSAADALDVARVDEDDVKVALSDAATACADEQGLSRAEVQHSAAAATWATKDWWECLARALRLPAASGVRLPTEVTRALFGKLWQSPTHWRLCAYQSPTAPVSSVDLVLTGLEPDGDLSLRASVLREEPLVLAVQGLATAEECAELVAAAGTDDLSMATVGGQGDTQTSRSRRTLTRNLWPEWERRGDVLTRVSRRFFEATRRATGFKVYKEGQEPVNWLFYKVGYEYRPHCDGMCGSQQVPLGKRVASSLLYCTVADEGGGTVFPPDGTKLEPTVGTFLLFAYNPDRRGLTLHAACPVLRGNKSTATQWYREGVSEAKPWDKFENWGNSFAKPR